MIVIPKSPNQKLRVAGAKSVIELIKTLDNNPSATPSTIPVGAVGILVNMSIGSPAIMPTGFLILTK